ncbi:MAG: class I SAM-dependent methyltransferase [Chlamydiales bacterium]|nr:class I SAM-dependent methyltransferase [Chlamydiia bacterium]MCP5508697.1 class I SAM-dependent methyltransferase [Chlamydiales bacterium]
MNAQKNTHTGYSLLDSGNGRKLEQFGPFIIERPASQAVWDANLPRKPWQEAQGVFTREEDKKWAKTPNKGDAWTLTCADIIFKIAPTDFGHLGIFPEQRPFWEWIQATIRNEVTRRQEVRVLNLFAYSGGSTLAAAKAGAHVCHLDASKGMVAWARENAELNGLEEAPIRWIIDDVRKFLARELRRGRTYDAIILDPPSFGRGKKGEVFKIEDDLREILSSCRQLLSDTPLFILFSCHTPGYTPTVMQHLLTQMMSGHQGKIDAGEMLLTGDNGSFALPSGVFARWCSC